MENQKVIGVGFHKTGTTTLGDCLIHLGYNHISCSREAFALYKASEISALLTLMDCFDSFEDWPWPFIYREAFEKYPEAKFILTTRPNEEVWFSSLTKHVVRPMASQLTYRDHIYGCHEPAENKAPYVNKYLQHNQSIRDFFADKPNSLIEVCWENGDGWEEICSFLGHDIPNVPFPHRNPARNQKNLSGKLKKKVASSIRRSLKDW